MRRSAMQRVAAFLQHLLRLGGSNREQKLNGLELGAIEEVPNIAKLQLGYRWRLGLAGPNLFAKKRSRARVDSMRYP